MRFNSKGGYNQTFGKRTLNKKTEEKLFQYQERLYNLPIYFFSNKKYDELYDQIIKNRGLVYIDPPYSVTEAGYSVLWKKQDDDNLYDFIDELNKQGIKFIMSNVSENKGIKNPYFERMKAYEIIEINHSYTKVARNKKLPSSKEIIIKNF